MPLAIDLSGRVALVTGGSRGLGRADALTLARAGADVVIADIQVESDSGEEAAGYGVLAQVARAQGMVYSEATAQEIQAMGRRAAAIRCDVTDREQVEATVARVVEELGSVDILVNNAGIQHVAPVEEFPIEQWDSIIAINLTSAFHTTRAAVPGMKKRKWGRIINICSAHSLRASPFKCAYVSAKHGLSGFTKTVALELAEHGVTANAISPGFVWTPLVEKQLPEIVKTEHITLEQAKNEVLSRQPTKEFVTVEQVAALAAFLASEAAASITGANYSIDGGWTAQ